MPHGDFSADEIAGYLGQVPWTGVVNIQLKGEDTPMPLTAKEMRKTLGFNYRSHMTFISREVFEEVLGECPYLLRCPWLIKENHELAERYREDISAGSTAKISIKWIDNTLGYGAFLDEDVPEGAFIGEYTGIVRRLYRECPDHNAYCFAYPTRLWGRKVFTIDAMKEGNVMRFCNHSEKPTLAAHCVVDRRLLHQIFVAARPLKKGTQLTFDYGQDYWERRHMVAIDSTKSPFCKLLDRDH